MTPGGAQSCAWPNFLKLCDKCTYRFSSGSNSTNTAVCRSLCVCICVSVPNLSKSVKETSTEARLAPVSCTVAYKQLYRVVQLGPNSRNSCSRSVLFSLQRPVNAKKKLDTNLQTQDRVRKTYNCSSPPNLEFDTILTNISDTYLFDFTIKM